MKHQKYLHLFKDSHGNKALIVTDEYSDHIEVNGLIDSSFNRVYYYDDAHHVEDWCKENNIEYKLVEKQFDFNELWGNPNSFKAEGEVKVVHEHGQPEGIRDKRGFLLSFPKVQKYQDQEERYVEELRQSFDLAWLLKKTIKSTK